jgi:hypothetical protein
MASVVPMDKFVRVGKHVVIPKRHVRTVLVVIRYAAVINAVQTENSVWMASV